MLIVLESRVVVTCDGDGGWWSTRDFSCAGAILTLDLGVGYTDVLTL